MASRSRSTPQTNTNPTSDGKHLAETDHHRQLMTDLIQTLEHHFASEPRVYVSGNLLLFYGEGNKRRHVSPDVFIVRGVPKHRRLNYLLWEEGKAPQFVIEVTSKTTRHKDQGDKRILYQGTLRVRECFLFDPFGDYLDPTLQGYRLRQGQYHPIREVEGRLPSQVLGLHLDPQGQQLLLFDPDTHATPHTRAGSGTASQRCRGTSGDRNSTRCHRSPTGRHGGRATRGRSSTGEYRSPTGEYRRGGTGRVAPTTGRDAGTSIRKAAPQWRQLICLRE